MIKEEKETIITYDESNNIAEIYTCSQNIIKKLNKLCDKYPDQYKLKNEDKLSKTYITSKKLIKFSYKRILSEESKNKIKERLSNYRIKNKVENIQ
jgi:hypothetical protein